MRLRCSECSTNYLVDPRKLGKGGRKVKCAKCGHQWFQDPPKEDPELAMPDIQAFEEELKAQPIPPGSALPVPKEKIGAGPGLKFFTVFFAATAGMFALFAHRDALVDVSGFSAVYDMIGMYETNGVRLQDISVAQMPISGKPTYFVQGTIRNTAEEDRKLPRLRIALLDEEYGILKGNLFEEDLVLRVGEKRQFNPPQFDSRAKDVRYVSIDIGNSWEMHFR